MRAAEDFPGLLAFAVFLVLGMTLMAGAHRSTWLPENALMIQTPSGHCRDERFTTGKDRSQESRLAHESPAVRSGVPLGRCFCKAVKGYCTRTRIVLEDTRTRNYISDSFP